MSTNRKMLGVIGGLGPMASAYFYRLVTERTDAKCDQEHIDMCIMSRASTPDRTAYLTGKSAKSPLRVLCDDAKRLEKMGAGVIVITCNTSHCFIDEIRKSVSVPIPGMIEETAEFLKKAGCNTAGIMATDGTVSTGLYQKALEKAGVGWALPDSENQKKVMSLIYDDVKGGGEISPEKFNSVTEHLRNMGCDRIILGCTELSVVNCRLGAKPDICDAMEVIAYKAIRACGGKAAGFPAEFDVMYEENL